MKAAKPFFIFFYFAFLSAHLVAQKDPFAREKIDTAVVEEIILPTLTAEEQLAQDLDSIVDSELGFKVPIITCRQLHSLQTNENKGQRLYILDARSVQEFNISHIVGARRIGYADFSSATVWTYNRSATLVIYSLNGEQGETIGLQMKEMGFKNVYNLYGSLIEWVNQGLPIVDAAGAPTNKVFTRTKAEGKALKKGKAVY
jgi:rhodanese-related sulfurtransferase